METDPVYLETFLLFPNNDRQKSTVLLPGCIYSCVIKYPAIKVQVTEDVFMQAFVCRHCNYRKTSLAMQRGKIPQGPRCTK